MTEDEKTFDQLLAELPANARAVAAKARNARIRVTAHHEGMLEQSKVLKSHVRVLRHRYGLGAQHIGRLVGVSRTRVLQILREK